MEDIRKQPAGNLKISRDVLATIARVAALEVEGVAGLVEPKGSMGKIFSKGLGRAIHIEMNDDFAQIELALNLNFGARIPETCAAVQNAVKDNIQTMTGLAVSKVNVLVEEIVFTQEPAQAPRQEQPD